MSPAVPRLTVVACCLCLLLAALGAGAVADAPTRPEHAEPHHQPAPSPAAAPTDAFEPPFQTGDVEPDSVLLRADVRPSGDATWTVEYRIRLDENATTGFRSLQRDIEANESRYTDRFERRMTDTVATAENATGRPMAVENVSVEARNATFGDYGVVAYRFDWRGFAATDGDRVVAGDALGGLFLDQRTRLFVAVPDGYATSDVSPTPDDRGNKSVAWDGRQDFGQGEPRVVAAPPGPGGAGLGLSVSTGLLAALALLLLGGLGVVWWRRTRSTGGEGADALAGTDASGGPPTPENDATGGEDGTDAGTAAASGAAGGADTSESADDGPPPDLLSNEERVLRLLRENGGRMKQQDVVAELGWTEAKTSQVVGGLRDEGDLDSFRLGRENVLTLPESDDES
jgi:hypothetical protein